MRITCIEFAGAIPEGQKLPRAIARVRRLSDDRIGVTILSPQLPGGERTFEARADRDDDLRSVAWCLLHHLDGPEDTGDDSLDYYHELRRFADSPHDEQNTTSQPGPSNPLIDALRDNISPNAVAAIASYLQAARTGDEDADRQIRWFTEQLAKALGGWDRQGKLADELGL